MNVSYVGLGTTDYQMLRHNQNIYVHDVILECDAKFDNKSQVYKKRTSG